MNPAVGLVIWLLLLFALERMWPRRNQSTSVSRWVANFSLGGLNWLLVRVLVSGGLVSIAFYADDRGLGLWHIVGLHGYVELLVLVVVLDCAIWGQHWLSHRWQWLWRLHRVHHLDMSVDVSTAVRFHPLEILVSLAFKIFLIFSFGISPLAVAVFELLLAGSAMFNHANLALPVGVDRLLRQVVVTPDMHRAHHSTVKGEHNTNFGFFFSFWDRLFRCYTASPAAGHEAMQLGLDESRDERKTKHLGKLLGAPFVSRI